jgi:hypothetical protein
MVTKPVITSRAITPLVRIFIVIFAVLIAPPSHTS